MTFIGWHDSFPMTNRWEYRIPAEAWNLLSPLDTPVLSLMMMVRTMDSILGWGML